MDEDFKFGDKVSLFGDKSIYISDLRVPLFSKRTQMVNEEMCLIISEATFKNFNLTGVRKDELKRGWKK